MTDGTIHITPIELSDEHRANLITLRDYLRQPVLKADFNMALYCEESGEERYRTDCGSVGCAIGHGPHAGIPKLCDEDWDRYARRAFGDATSNAGWDWCFSPNWKIYDNTPQGAADRIDWMMTHGGVPKDFNFPCFDLPAVCRQQAPKEIVR